MKTSIKRSTMLSLGVLLGATPVFAQQAFKNETDLVAAVMPSFVDIYNRGVVADPTGAGGAPRIQDEVGSGFIVDPSGIIVTNRHVIEGAYALFVMLSDGTRVPAKLLGKALTFDIALIKIDVGHPLPVAKLGDSDKLHIGDRVVAIGNPLGFSNSASTGIISAFHRNVGLSAYDNLIQTDATINQGNSGGPLFNMNGDVVGVNEAIYTQNKGGSIGIGFSIPINEAKYLVANVKKYGTPHIGWLGVTGQTVTDVMANALNRDSKEGGVVISDITAGGSAAAAGLKVGDVILKMDGVAISTISALNRATAGSVDKTVQTLILRDGKETTVPVAIKPWPSELWSSKLADAPTLQSLADFGLTFAPATNNDGPVVASVTEKSIAHSAGIKAGDIIRKVQSTDIHSTDDPMKEMLALRAKGVSNAMVLVGGPNGARWLGVSVKE